YDQAPSPESLVHPPSLSSHALRLRSSRPRGPLPQVNRPRSACVQRTKDNGQMETQIRVLVVDDEESHAVAVAESLGRVGYDCIVATSGAEALRLIEEQVFDIVITDLVMQGVGGMEVLAKAKRELPDAEVVILTGHSTVKGAVTAMQAGASNYLIKP